MADYQSPMFETALTVVQIVNQVRIGNLQDCELLRRGKAGSNPDHVQAGRSFVKCISILASAPTAVAAALHGKCSMAGTCGQQWAINLRPCLSVMHEVC